MRKNDYPFPSKTNIRTESYKGIVGIVRNSNLNHDDINEKEVQSVPMKHNNQMDKDSIIISRRQALVTTTASIIIALSTSAASNSNAVETKLPSLPKIMNNDDSTLPSITLNSKEAVTPSPSSSLTTLQETISGFVSGATITTTKTFVKYPLDTATVRLQMKSTPYSISNLYELFKGSYNGITTPLVSNIPAGAVFFAIKDATKSILKGVGKDYDVVIPKWVSTCIAVGVATPPYWLIRNPSEVIKTRQQVGATTTTSSSTIKNDGDDGVASAWGAIKTVYESNNNSTMDTIKELYTGFSENVLYGYPADVIKFVAYEALSSSASSGKNSDGKISPLDGAIYGAGATAIAQFLTTPLDVVRNRIMVESKNDNTSTAENSSYIDTITTLAKEEGLKGLFAGSTPRIAKSLLSGAIQFATYEETKESFRKMFEKR